MEKTLIDIAYDLAKTKFNKKSFTFKQLWTELVKRAKLDQKEQQQVGNLFTTMLQDHRFIFAGNDEWKIREFLTLEEQNELSNALYDFAKEEDKPSKVKDDDMDDSDFNNYDDEDDEYKKHAEASLDDEDDEDDDEGEVEERDSDDEDDESEEESEEENEQYK